jgi:hypothetical protein
MNDQTLDEKKRKNINKSPVKPAEFTSCLFSNKRATRNLAVQISIDGACPGCSRDFVCVNSTGANTAKESTRASSGVGSLHNLDAVVHG